MANLQALATDNQTIIYLSSEGDGTELVPFQSVFFAEQYGSWVVDTQLAQPLTDTELRAAPIIVDIQLLQPLTDAELRAAPVTVDTQLLQALTDSELRAAPVVVNTQQQQPLTHTELMSESLPLPVGAANATNQLSIPGFNIPEYDTLITTEDANGELVSVQYKKSSTIVKTLNFTYSDVVFAAPYRTTTVEAV